MFKIGLVLLMTATIFGCTRPEHPKRDERQPFDKIQEPDPKIRFSYNPKVDILFVVDDSGSMSSHQVNLAKNIKLFTEGLGQNAFLDYQVGVVSTSVDVYKEFGTDIRKGGGRLSGNIKIVTKNTPDALRHMAENILVGERGSGTEQIFDSAIKALTPPVLNRFNSGFLRHDSHLVVIPITDAYDQSDISAKEFLDQLIAIKKGKAKLVLAYGAIIPTPSSIQCSRDGRTGGVGSRKLEDFFDLAIPGAKGANYFNLCSSDYGEKLTGISNDLTKRLESFIPFTNFAIDSSITVSFGSQVLENNKKTGWSYDPCNVGINLGEDVEFIEEPGAKLKIEYAKTKVIPSKDERGCR